MTTKSILQQYYVHDFINWNQEKVLKLNPDFQRRSVWTPQAKVFLIDTILREMPIPKIYIRTTIDSRTKKSLREVVDGQQRLRAILDFANDKFQLTSRAGDYAGKRYSELPEEAKDLFLTYPLAVDQLVNASDTDVLEVFARLNSYNVSLNPAEKRHARYQGEFKWEVHQASLEWKVLWEDWGLVSARDRLRMGDDTLMAEMYQILLVGVSDGGAEKIDRLYSDYDESFPEKDRIRKQLNNTLEYVSANFADLISSSELRRGTQFLMLFAAFASQLVGIPQGQYDRKIPSVGLDDLDSVRSRLTEVAASLEDDGHSGKYAGLVAASKGSTQRIATRRVRFAAYLDVVTGSAGLAG